MTIGLWWLLSLALYLLLDLYISSLIVGILKSRWIVSLVTYQGAFIRDLSVVAALDSKLPNGVCPVPRCTRTIPYEQMIARCR